MKIFCESTFILQWVIVEILFFATRTREMGFGTKKTNNLWGCMKIFHYVHSYNLHIVTPIFIWSYLSFLTGLLDGWKLSFILNGYKDIDFDISGIVRLLVFVAEHHLRKSILLVILLLKLQTMNWKEVMLLLLPIWTLIHQRWFKFGLAKHRLEKSISTYCVINFEIMM